MKLKSIKQVKNLNAKKVLLRVDFNVPFKNGKIADDSRIRAALPTISFLIKKGAKVIVATHLGRPALTRGRPDGKIVPALSTKVLAQALARLLKQPVLHLTVFKLPANFKLAMLENIRFYPEEEGNNAGFAKKLAALADLYVNDAFSVSHRAHASVEAVTRFLPSYAGLNLEAEVLNLSKVLESPLKPKVAIIGGAKLETKVKIIKHLLKKMDYVCLGGAIANNVLKQLGYEVGLSKVDESRLEVSEAILKNKLRLPLDVAAAKDLSPQSAAKARAVGQVKKDEIILDIGPETVGLYSAIIKKAKLVVWNGPLGYFEVAQYKKSSQQIAQAIVKSKPYSIVGGGETIQMIRDLGLITKFNFVSTAGGAMLEFLEGKVLPGIKPLIKK